LEAPDTFRTFVSTQQEHFQFGSSSSHASFLTADNVALDIEATLFFRVGNVELLFTTSISSVADMMETLRLQAMSTLLSIVRSEYFSNIGKERSLTGHGDQMSGPQATVVSSFNDPNAAQSVASNVSMGFQSIIHDAEPMFLKNMERFSNRYGFEIESLRIEKIEFSDKVLQKSISEFAVTFTKLAAQEATIAAERKVELAEAERDAARREIESQAENNRNIKAAMSEADAAKIAANSSAQLLRVTAEAEAEALKIKGKADADVIIWKAEAEATALRALGDAEAANLEKKGAHPNAALSILVDGQVRAFAGIEKLVYCNTDTQMLLQQTTSALAQAMNAQDKKR
jgi:regulator of protease activity HflC (stomatin/prohibitin superfamily)